MEIFRESDFSARKEYLAKIDQEIKSTLATFERQMKSEVVKELIDSARKRFESNGEMKGYYYIRDANGLSAVADGKGAEQLQQLIADWLYEEDIRYTAKVDTRHQGGERFDERDSLSIDVEFTYNENWREIERQQRAEMQAATLQTQINWLREPRPGPGKDKFMYETGAYIAGLDPNMSDEQKQDMLDRLTSSGKYQRAQSKQSRQSNESTYWDEWELIIDDRLEDLPSLPPQAQIENVLDWHDYYLEQKKQKSPRTKPRVSEQAAYWDDMNVYHYGALKRYRGKQDHLLEMLLNMQPGQLKYRPNARSLR